MPTMNGLYIKGTSKTPEVDFTSGVIQLSGRSIPEDAVSFYQPLIRWVNSYVENPEKFTKVNFRIEYINSGSNRFIYAIFKLLDDCFVRGNDVAVTWYYEEDDDTIKGLGKDFQSLLKVPIKLVEVV
ncbi:MAG: DUF1987 domain-containing protein [Bacteroidales bacterium]|nr:MAG: DUF1987 domain-containing protein [Bacteroidales bacterium]